MPTHKHAPSRLALAAALAIFTVLGLLTALPGCGYSTKPTYDTQYQSVFVPIFKNRTFYQGLEFDVTKAVINEIETRTPYKSLTTSTADTTIEGTIISVDQTIVSRERETGLPQDMEFRVTLDIVWKKSLTDKIIRERKGMVVIGRFLPNQTVGDTYFRGQHEAAQHIAQQVVALMRSDW